MGRYKIEKGSAVIFDGRLLHEVLPVTKGKRYVLQAFLFDETGWELKKVKNDKNSFKLLDAPNIVEKKQNEDWDIYDGKNMVHCKVSHLNENYIGTYKYLSDVLNYLKHHKNKIYFCWHNDKHIKQKWRGRAYAWDLSTCKLKQ